ncbi:MAG: hypothetical protein AAF713_13865 [Pseudomonadota bacterium]
MTTLVVACSPQAVDLTALRQSPPAETNEARFLVLESPPTLDARSTADLGTLRDRLDRLSDERLASRTEARRVAADALPYLSSSPEGLAFLAMAAPRALARGKPAEACPAIGIASNSNRTEAVTSAIRQCLRRLEPSHRSCGCEVIAYDDVLAVPRAEVAYATGTTARLRAPELGLDAILVAEDELDGSTLLRDLSGPVARLTPDGSMMRLVFEDDRGVFEGRAIAEGFRRGRLAQRIYARDEQGRRLSLLIGFAPSELAQSAGAWLAFPPEG